MALPDIDTLSIQELEALKESIETRLEKERSDALSTLRRRFAVEAEKFGLTLHDVLLGIPSSRSNFSASIGHSVTRGYSVGRIPLENDPENNRNE